MIRENEIKETGWNLDNSYARLPKSFFTSLKPTPVPLPKLIILNYPLASSLGLNVSVLKSSDGIEMLAGNQIPQGALPLAQAYAGHQFGHFTMLGDGRALLLGEQITPLGERFDIQLKGSGKTPYSRGRWQSSPWTHAARIYNKRSNVWPWHSYHSEPSGDIHR